MTDAREIIAQTLGHHPGWSRTTDAILAALTAAGFRILGPGEVDHETVERCAVAGDAWFAATKDAFAKKHGQNFITKLRESFARRALKEEQS